MPDSTLSWSSQTDWDAASSRRGVLSRSIGAKNGGTLQLGLDPQYGPQADAEHYWPLDQSSGDAEDVINGATGVLVNDTEGDPKFREPGPLGGYSFYGDGASFDLADRPNFLHGGSYSIFAWAYRVEDDNFDHILSTDRIGDGRPGRVRFEFKDGGVLTSYYNDDNGENYSTRVWDGAVTDEPLRVMIVHDDTKDDNSGVMYVEDLESSTSEYKLPHPDRAAQADYSADGAHLADRYGSGSRSRDKKLSDVIYWQRALSPDEKKEIWDSFEEGHLTTAWQADSNRLYEIETSTTLPTNTSAVITVQQDVSGDGSVDRAETVDLVGGSETISVSGFESSPSSQYRAHFELSTGTQFSTPKVSSVVYNLESLDTATWNIGSGGSLDITDGSIDMV